MSLCYQFELPTTGNLSLSQLRSIEYRQLLLDADSRRALVRDTLKKAKRSTTPDIIAVINAIDNYIPYLFTILGALKTGEIEPAVPPLVPSWRLPLRSALSVSPRAALIEPPRVEVASLEYERGMVLYTYALAYMAAAEAVQASAPVTSEQDKETGPADRLKQISGHLRRAESLFRYLLETPNEGLASIPDLSAQVLGGFITFVSGSLHMAMVHKALRQESLESSALYSRVSLFAAEKFASAYQMFTSAASAAGFSSGSTNNEDSKSRFKKLHVKASALKQLATQSPLLGWLDGQRRYCIAAAEVFMAGAAYNGNNVGLAVGFLAHARDTTSSEGGSHSSTAQVLLRDRIADLLRRYTAENDRISFQEVPGPEAVVQKWPSGRKVVDPQEPWVPPVSLLNESIKDTRPTPAPTTQQGYY